MRAARTAAIALVLAAAATAPAFGIASVSVYGLRAPEEISGFTLNDSTNFEKTKPGDGYGLDYSQSGWKLDVFIYDLKRAAIPDDAKSAIVRAEFERARADAFLAQPRGIYAQVYLRRNFTIEDGGKRTRFQCATFHMTRDGAKPQDGFLCVTSWNNKFVKLRLATLADANTEADARKFVGAWIQVLWGGGSRAVEDKPAKPAPATRSERRAAQQPEPRAQQRVEPARPQPRPRPVMRRPKCPEGYICEYR
ncbi:MAG: hypothetical protein K2Z80_35620 [Xanthobacteraceae bacterium]|nr:hypothetical protein [Xanthobacteraceae bacterium]